MKKTIARIKWHLKEFDKIYSNEPSYYSKKRIESGLAFLVGLYGMTHWLLLNIEKLSSTDIAVWAGIIFAISGYTLNKIQSEKKANGKQDTESISHVN